MGIFEETRDHVRKELAAFASFCDDLFRINPFGWEAFALVVEDKEIAKVIRILARIANETRERLIQQYKEISKDAPKDWPFDEEFVDKMNKIFSSQKEAAQLAMSILERKRNG